MCAALLLLTVFGRAQTQTTRTWDGGGADSNWSTPANWSGDNVPDSVSEAALFTSDPVGRTKLTPTLSANVTVGQLQYSATAPSYTIAGSGAPILYISPSTSYGGVGVSVASGAANQVIAPEVFFLSTQTWDIGGSTTLTASGTIEDDSVIDYGLTKNGTGTLVFPGDVRYDGPTTVNAGALVLSFSNTSMLSSLTVNGGTLRATSNANALGSNATRNAITLAGGALELANNTGLTFGSTSRVTTVTGNATIRSDRIAAGAGVTHTLGPLRIGDQTLSVTAGSLVNSGTAGITVGATTLSGSATFNVVNGSSASAQLTLGAIGQSGGARSVTKSGDGVLRLNGAASYTGSTTLNQGTVTLGASNALGSGGLIFAGGRLNGNDVSDSTIGALALTADSTLQLSPGGAAATLTFAGVSGAAGGVLTITGWSGAAGGLGTNDRIVFSGGTAPSADFLQHIHFDLGDGKTYTGALGAGGELFPIAAGGQTSAVPNVVGQTQAQASSAVTAAGLIASVTTQTSVTVQIGRVLSQSPDAGTVVSPGSTVFLVVSSGVIVPDVGGQTQSAATAALTAAGFAVTSSSQASASVPSGSVVSQSPAGGAAASGGSTVALVISTGPPANITLANAQSAQSTMSGSFVDLAYTVPGTAGSPLVLVVYGGAEASTTNLALPAGATFHGTSMNVAAQLRTPATGTNAGAGLYWLPVSPNESGTIRLTFTGTCDERAVGAVTLVNAKTTGPEAVESATGTASLSDQIATLSTNAMVISTATQGNNTALTATGTGHVLDVSAALASSRVAGGHAEVASPSARTLGYSGSINRIAMILAAFPVAAAPAAPVIVPDVTNTQQAAAQSALIAAGLQPGAITTAYSASVPAASVISQNPVGGTSVPGGSSVSLVVSLGAEPNAAPAIVLTAPADHAKVSGGAALLAASVTDTDATSVTFYGRKTVPIAPGPDFVIGTLPDTQFYSQNTGGMLSSTFFAQTQWYADSRRALNLAFVSHLGDMVQSGDNGTNNSEWNIADQAMQRLEDPVATGLPFGIPWGGAPGNHDDTTVGQTNAPNAKWNLFFGADRWAGRPYFGGSFSPTNNSNNYELFEASGLEFLIIHLGYTTAAAVDQSVLDWADGLMKAYPQRRAIVTSHWILDAPPASPVGAPAPFGGPGQRFFDAFKGNPNFFLMLSGHVSGEGRRSDVFAGRTIYSVFQDYQSRSNGGDGWLRYFVFSPANNTITAKTYSPTRDRFETDTDATSSPVNQASEFVLPYDMQHGVGPWTVLSTVDIAAGGGIAQFTWPSLDPGSTYEWYAAASDGQTTTAAPPWTFVTAATTAPTISLTSPLNNATFTAPATVTLTAAADDTDSFVTKVEFFDGATKLGEDTTPPYSYTWANAPVGGHVLTAVVTDYAGATATSSAAAITVNTPANVPPAVTLTAPANNTVFTAPATVTLTANAGDSDGTVTKVEFFSGATKLGEDTTSPYSFTWSNVTAGVYDLTARATDNTGASTPSGISNIVVNAPPSVTLTAPSDGTAFTSPAAITLTADAIDTDGTIVLVEFYSGATKLGEDATSPYSYTWANPPAGSPSLTARATDNRGATAVSAPVTIQIASASTSATNACPCSLWTTSTTPGPLAPDPDGVELGVKFRADAAGTILGIRFYKYAQNTGTHSASLWNASGTRMGTATFTGETASGWQQVMFTTPIAIAANTTYIASYFTPSGNYALTEPGFSSQIDNAPLHALANTTAGGNGVYRYGTASGFPNQTWNASNYWVDVIFKPTDSTPPVISAVAAAPASGGASITWSTNEAATSRVDYGTSPSLGSSVTNAALVTAHTVQLTGLTPGTTYYYTVTSLDAATNAASSPAAPATFVTPAPASPSSVVLQAGTPAGGSVSSLSADDNNYYMVASTTSGTRTTTFDGVFTGVPSNLSSLAITYKGKNSASRAQTISIWRWTTSSWVQLNSQSVSTTEVLASNLTPPGAPGGYVDAAGTLQVRVTSTGTANFTTSADLMQIVYGTN
jgi:autotransporter-associated beta strand protein